MPRFKVKYRVSFCINHVVEANSYEGAEIVAMREEFIMSLNRDPIDVDLVDIEEIEEKEQ